MRSRPWSPGPAKPVRNSSVAVLPDSWAEGITPDPDDYERIRRLLYDPTRILVAADDIHALAMTLRLRE
jgi:hypothetical protein